jgi:hypothetical protein
MSKDAAPARHEPQRRPLKARTVPREGIEREEKSLAEEQRYGIRRVRGAKARRLG